MPVTRAQNIAEALEAEIRERVKHRSWYRRNRETYRWADLERENERALLLLFSVRRDGIRQERELDRQHRAAHEAREWAESVASGQYVTLPDVPLARTEDPGDWFAYPVGAA